MPDLIAMLMVVMANADLKRFSVSPESLEMAKDYSLVVAFCAQCHCYHVELLTPEELEGLVNKPGHDDEAWLKTLRIRP